MNNKEIVCHYLQSKGKEYIDNRCVVNALWVNGIRVREV